MNSFLIGVAVVLALYIAVTLGEISRSLRAIAHGIVGMALAELGKDAEKEEKDGE